MPPNPSAAALRKLSTGKVSFSSQSRAYGIISSRANWRAVDWKARCSSVRSKSMTTPALFTPISKQDHTTATVAYFTAKEHMLVLISGEGIYCMDETSRPATGGHPMAESNDKRNGPDLALGVSAAELKEGAMLTGHVGDDEVLLVRQGGTVSAIAAHCTHYHGPLADGLVVGNTIRCPWHHACFDLKTGEALAAPALSPLTCWQADERDGQIVVKGKKAHPAPKKTGPAGERIVIVGGGAAGFAAAEMMRPRGFAGSITMFSNDNAAPVDRPNLSKNYLAGSAPEDWY